MLLCYTDNDINLNWISPLVYSCIKLGSSCDLLNMHHSCDRSHVGYKCECEALYRTQRFDLWLKMFCSSRTVSNVSL